MPQPAGEPRKFISAPTGKITAGLAPSVITFRIGECLYDYRPREMGFAYSRSEGPFWFWDAPRTIYHVRLEADFTLSLLSHGFDGQQKQEVTSNGWPAKPQVDCLTKG
jgi:hypothetical protein